MFIQTETTPNPETLKFYPGRDISPKVNYDFENISAAETSPLAQKILSIDGVSRVFLGTDFLSVTKQATQDWSALKTLILAAIMDHFVAGLPVLNADMVDDSLCANIPDMSDYSEDVQEIITEIVELLDTRIRPAVAQDGGDIVFDSFDPQTGLVKLHMRGACAGCPASSMTLKQGVENMLRHYIPEVTSVEAVL